MKCLENSKLNLRNKQKKLKQKIKQKQIIRTKIRIINKRIMRMKIIIERKIQRKTKEIRIKNR